jgi:hypothetical protein
VLDLGITCSGGSPHGNSSRMDPTFPRTPHQRGCNSSIELYMQPMSNSPQTPGRSQPNISHNHIMCAHSASGKSSVKPSATTIFCKAPGWMPAHPCSSVAGACQGGWSSESLLQCRACYTFSNRTQDQDRSRGHAGMAQADHSCIITLLAKVI